MMERYLGGREVSQAVDASLGVGGKREREREREREEERVRERGRKEG